jgi:hypothetical protein
MSEFILLTRGDRRRLEQDERRWPAEALPADVMWQRGRPA